jgi:hypothetical protein
MCLVIDASAMSRVFDNRNAEHHIFKPVAAWVLTGNGSVIYGGTKYLQELGYGKYLALFQRLRKAKRAVLVDRKSVDDRAAALKIMVPEKNFNDPHIVALVGISRCCVVCTSDDKALPYIRRRELYPDGVRVPFVYNTLAAKKHCCNRHLVDICPKRAIAKRGKKPKSRPSVKLVGSHQ